MSAVVVIVAGTLAVVVIAVVVGGLVVRSRYLVVTVDGSSMQPTFKPGDRLLVRRGRPVRTGDVVVFGPQDGSTRPTGGGIAWIVKRVAAVPGDPVPQGVPALAELPQQHVPAGKVVLLGDNPDSQDSRQHGYFAADRVHGTVLRPLSR